MGLLNRDLGKKVYLTSQKGEYKRNGLEVAKAEDSAEVIILTATENFSKAETGVLSNFPVASGQERGDHYRRDGAKVNFSGIITPGFITLIGGITALLSDDEESDPVQDYIQTVKKFIYDNEDSLVTVYLPDGNAVENCVITDFTIRRDVQVSNGYRVDVSLQEFLLADEAIEIAVADVGKEPTDEDLGDQSGDEKDRNPSGENLNKDLDEPGTVKKATTGLTDTIARAKESLPDIPKEINVKDMFTSDPLGAIVDKAKASIPGIPEVPNPLRVN